LRALPVAVRGKGYPIQIEERAIELNPLGQKTRNQGKIVKHEAAMGVPYWLTFPKMKQKEDGQHQEEV